MKYSYEQIWSNIPIYLWWEFKHHQDVSAMYKSVLCLSVSLTVLLHCTSCLPSLNLQSFLLTAGSTECRTLTQEGISTTPGTGSDPTPRKQFIALTKWCNSFPDKFSLVFHIPEQEASFSSRHESYTRQVDSNPFLADLCSCTFPALPCPMENITEHLCLSPHLV